MRTALGPLLALLLPACLMDGTPALDEGSGGVDLSRGERCDIMRACGQAHCEAEILAPAQCVSSGCTDEELQDTFLQRAFCLQDSGCNMTSCDIVQLAMGVPCPDPAEGEIVSMAIDGMVSEEIAAQCAALK